MISSLVMGANGMISALLHDNIGEKYGYKGNNVQVWHDGLLKFLFFCLKTKILNNPYEAHLPE